jgi:catechol 2,3-dioxygenase-like lactoylglutathione lyase family enzyme
MSIQAMNHFTVLARDVDATKAFYIGLLGFTDGPRPSFDFPGAWLYLGDHAVLHIIAGRPVPDPPAGVLDHIAFSASNLGETVARLKTHKIDYVLRRQAGDGPWQLFCHDPNGAKLELDYSADEAAPAAG